MKKSSPGFTLVELLVTISAAALVLACAVSFMLLGLRMENHSTETASRQQTINIIMTMVEQMAAEGDIGIKQTENNPNWELLDGNGSELLCYDADSKTLQWSNNSENNSILLSELDSAEVSISGDNIFTLSVTINGDMYKTSVFCRPALSSASSSDTTITSAD